MITIAYINFWKNNGDVQDRWLLQFIKHNIDDNIQEVHHSSNPDILIASNFGSITNIKNISSKVKIFFYGENLNRYPPYNNIELLKNVFDIIIGFKYTDKSNKIYRLPLWITYYPYYNMDSSSNIITHIQNEYNKNIQIEKKDCSLIARHDRGGQRTILYNEFIQYMNVLCPSSFKKNCPSIQPGNKSKIDFIKKTIYNICPENSCFEGYYTEKIFQALEAGCIPIYYATDIPEKEILNEDCYCFIPFISEDDTRNKIYDVIHSKNKYIQSSLFKYTAHQTLKTYYDDVKNAIIDILNL